MNTATQIPLQGIPVAQFSTRWDYARHVESRRVLSDPRRLANALKDAIDDDNAHAIGYVLKVAAAILAVEGDTSLQMILNAAANEAALFADV